MDIRRKKAKAVIIREHKSLKQIAWSDFRADKDEDGSLAYQRNDQVTRQLFDE
jgi:hypothetical protein